MGKSDLSGTPKSTFTLKNLGGKEFSTKDASFTGIATLKFTRGPVLASLQVSEKTPSGFQSLKDSVLCMDYTVPKSKKVVLTSKLNLDSLLTEKKLFQAGLTYTGRLADRDVGFKASYASKDKKVTGETFVSFDKNNKTTLAFTNEKVTSAKHASTNGDLTFEPSYNFEKEAPAFAISKKQGKNTFKLSYDLKSEKASAEWVAKPMKITAESKLSGYKPAPVTLTAVFEKVYEF